MKCSKLARWFVVFGLAITLTPALAFTARADAVTDWNVIMQATVSTPPTNPNIQTRWGAIVQLAVFEAVNAIEGDYEPYLGGLIVAPAAASPDAAAIAAAHRTLATLRPASAPALGVLRAASLAAIPDGPAKEDGIAVGEAAGAFLPGWGLVTPFGLEVSSQFRLPPPPALHTGKYANDYDEVRLLGSLDSPFRPQDRTNVARFYAATSPVALWNSGARQASAAQGKSLAENARIFALLAMAMGDAAIACWDTKYHFDFWRPQTAIRNGDLDGNRLTDRDPAWLPLISTPAHPSYASGHATVSGAARVVLERAFGKDDHAIVLTNPALPAIVLGYTAWDEITDDIDDARIYGGIHFRFDQEAGARQGRQVGAFILRKYLRPLDEIDDDDLD